MANYFKDNINDFFENFGEKLQDNDRNKIVKNKWVVKPMDIDMDYVRDHTTYEIPLESNTKEHLLYKANVTLKAIRKWITENNAEECPLDFITSEQTFRYDHKRYFLKDKKLL